MADGDDAASAWWSPAAPGFIGVHSVEALLDAGAEVLVIDDLRHASYRPLPGAARLEVADVAEAGGARRHRASGSRRRSSTSPPRVASTAPGASRRADAHINVLGTVSVLAGAIAAGCRRVVVASSGGALYGAASRLPTPEDEPTQPRSPYGTAKLSIEHYLGHFTRAGSLDALALRYGNVYGPGQDGTGEAGVVAISSHRLLDGKAPVIRGDGTQTRDFTYVGDVVAANLLGLASSVTGALNIGTGRETAIGDLVRTSVRARRVQRGTRARAAATRGGGPKRPRQLARRRAPRMGAGGQPRRRAGTNPRELPHPGRVITRWCARR